MTTLLGFLAVAVSGVLVGAGNWPYKKMQVYRFEHWMLLGTFLGMVVFPWTLILVGCPNAIECLRNIPTADLIRSNLFSIAWGVSIILSCQCYVRIGIGLTIALLVGVAIPVGTITTLIFKGSGEFHDAPSLWSSAGLTILASVVMMVGGIVLTAMAGFGREQQQHKTKPATGSFAGGLVMMLISGVLVSGMNFAFVYGQDSIRGNLSVIRPGDSISVAVRGENMQPIKGVYTVDSKGAITLPRIGRMPLEGATAWLAARQIEKTCATTQEAKSVRAYVDTGSIIAVYAASVVPLTGGALVACGYTVFVLFRDRTWPLFFQNGWDFGLVVIMAATNALAFLLWGKGSLMLGAVGASIGWGISQATKVIGSVGLAYVSGEWHGVKGKPLVQMRVAAAILISAALVMAYGKTLCGT